jgi:hypothetical protein
MNANNATKLINKINRETKEGKILWTRNNRTPSSLEGSERLANGIYYTSPFEGKYLRLYKYKSKSYSDEDVFDWVDGLRLELIDDMHNSLWDFPNDAATNSLYDTIRFKTADIDNLFDSYLKGEIIEPQGDDF